MGGNTLRQPKGFSVFFLTEMWERYGFYVVQYSLAIYLLQRFHLRDVQIYALIGSFTALSYVCPLIGGFIADNALGFRRTVLLGAISLCFGYALFAATTSIHCLYIALGIISMGTGFLKPNVAGFLGSQYKENDPRQHKGFTLFYVGVNLGEVLAALASGYLVGFLGWHGMYATAAVGLLLGSLVFYYGIKINKLSEDEPKLSLKTMLGILELSIIVVGFNALILSHEILSLIVFALFALGAIALVINHAKEAEAKARNGIIACFILTALSAVFWAIYFQLYSSLNLYIYRAVDHHFLGIFLPTTVYGGIESLGVVLLGPVLGFLWLRLRHSKHNPNIATKFTLGFVFMTLCMFILYLATAGVVPGGKVSSGWLILAYFLLAIGELSLSPIGLSMVTEYVPTKLVGLMMGIWFLATGIGGKLAGVFADISAIPKGLHGRIAIDHVYQHAFLIYTLIALGASVVCLAVKFMLVDKLMDSRQGIQKVAPVSSLTIGEVKTV